MQTLITKTLRPFLIIAGLVTMLPGLMTVSPELGLQQLFQLNLVSEYTIVVQHWGYMISLVGLFMVICVFKASLLFPVMLYAALEKAGVLFLCITDNDQP